MNGKLIVLVVLCFVMGIAFFAAGFYFGRQKDSSVKKCSYISFAVGGMTFLLGGIIIAIPQMAAIMALVYIFMLLLASIALMIMFRGKKY